MYGNILRVDLTEEKIRKEPVPKEWQMKYMGGEGMNDKLLWDHFTKVDPKIDPISPDNIIIWGVGPLGATGALGCGTKSKWTFKSPVYNCFGDSVGGGFFGVHMRWAGYDNLVVTGRAKKPVYLFIEDETVEIRDASALWGKGATTTDRTLKNTLGEDFHTAAIGQGGENLVRYANVIMDGERAAGRTGGGCVLGSKNLKAVAVHGTKGIKIYDPERFLNITEESYNRSKTSGYIWWYRYARDGTMFLNEMYNILGANPWKNNQYNAMPAELLEKCDSTFFMEKHKIQDRACSAGCATACSKWWMINGDESPASRDYTGEQGDKPEYVTWASCNIWGCEDMAAVLHFQSLWNELEIDVIEIGTCIAFLMELYQRGIITENDMKEWTGEALPLNWGDWRVADKISRWVANKSNKLYDILGKGVYHAAEVIGQMKGVDVMKYCQYGGKKAPFIEDFRSRRSWAVLMATSTRGCDHLKALDNVEHARLADLSKKIYGTAYPATPRIPYTKGLLGAWAENHTTAMNCTGLCIFNTAVWSWAGEYPAYMVPEAIYAVTGNKITAEEIEIIGERAYNIEKAFNARVGLTRKDDALCYRWMKEAIPAGYPAEGMKCEDYFEEMMDEYYDFKGWDKKTGLQTKSKLVELGLGDVAAVLEKEGVLSNATPRPRAEVLAEAVKKAEAWKGDTSHIANPKFGLGHY